MKHVETLRRLETADPQIATILARRNPGVRAIGVDFLLALVASIGDGSQPGSAAASWLPCERSRP